MSSGERECGFTGIHLNSPLLVHLLSLSAFFNILREKKNFSNVTKMYLPGFVFNHSESVIYLSFQSINYCMILISFHGVICHCALKTVIFILILTTSQRRRGLRVASRLLAAIGVKLVGPHGDLQIGKCRAFCV